MKRFACALLTTMTLACPAWAQADKATTTSWWRPFVGIGYSWGGHTLLPGKITVIGTSTTYEEDISAGAGLDLRTGIVLMPSGFPVGIKAAAAYHVDGASGLNARWSFRRHPFELGLTWSVNDRFALGAGARRSTRAKLRTHKDDYPFTRTDSNNVSTSFTAPADGHQDYSANTGTYIEAEWRPAHNWALQARYVRERFTLKEERFESQYITATETYGSDAPKYSGDHIGLALVYYFK